MIVRPALAGLAIHAEGGSCQAQTGRRQERAPESAPAQQPRSGAQSAESGPDRIGQIEGAHVDGQLQGRRGSGMVQHE